MGYNFFAKNRLTKYNAFKFGFKGLDCSESTEYMVIFDSKHTFVRVDRDRAERKR